MVDMKDNKSIKTINAHQMFRLYFKGARGSGLTKVIKRKKLNRLMAYEIAMCENAQPETDKTTKYWVTVLEVQEGDHIINRGDLLQGFKSLLDAENYALKMWYAYYMYKHKNTMYTNKDK